jgi:hypothetical protein
MHTSPNDQERFLTQADEEYRELICNGWTLDPEPTYEPAVARAEDLGHSLRRTASATFPTRFPDPYNPNWPGVQTRMSGSSDLQHSDVSDTSDEDQIASNLEQDLVGGGHTYQAEVAC